MVYSNNILIDRELSDEGQMALPRIVDINFAEI